MLRGQHRAPVGRSLQHLHWLGLCMLPCVADINITAWYVFGYDMLYFAVLCCAVLCCAC